MLTPAYCNGCGQRLEVPAGYSKSKMRCGECGVFTELPKEVREQGQEARTPNGAKQDKPEPPRPARRLAPAAEELPAVTEENYKFIDEEPPAKPTAPPNREVLIQGTEEDDLNPYTVTGDVPTKRCPECDKKVEIRAKVCVHCGFNFESGVPGKRTYQPVERLWENGWPLEKRVMLFVAFQVINFLTLVASLIGDFSLGVTFMMVFMSVGLQAFLCGTFDKLSLTRTAKGKVTLKAEWRYAFIPRPPEAVKWKEHESVIIVQSNQTDFIDWAMALILLSYCVAPGVLFYWFVIRPDKFTVTLCRDHGFPETAIFRTTNEERAKEVMLAVSDITTLPVYK